MYIRQGLQEQVEPLIYGGGQQDGVRSGTVPMPLCVGMGIATQILACMEGSAERNRVSKLRDAFVSRLQRNFSPLRLNGASTSRRHPGNANIRFERFDARDILGSLQPRLAASTGAACTSGIPEPSHVLRAMGLTDSESNASIRFSFGRFTTNDEVDMAADLVIEALDALTPQLGRRSA